ncbi:branched-chain amino acid ABC transporter substrate-binding protein [Brucella sp. ZJ1_1]|nr:branched-chain amino acid ABC transporter substrate-binding protein [Brucella intermedia]ELT49652.1 extracellular ligand-binding receptor [Brucella intermedia M86]MCB4917002.1 branched-chain amino acid ABC transporter substrate-binding protein [Brucella intermedia]NKB95537.1 branched-chain amino acid ABC transporter substrate-binding protein [Brucella intermedia]OOC49983.1 branched chain amino acid ABC transporter substrate-binding protein [Brucella intermedia M86]SUB13689.1 Leucine-, isole
MKKSLFCGVCLSALVAMGGVSFADIQLGVGAPLTGSQAAFGEQIKRGVEAAVAEANAKGGMNGEQITIVYGDDAADPKQGISVANKFVGDGVQFVIGHFNSGVSIPTSDIYAENGVLMIAPGTTNPTFTERELWNTFRTCRRDDKQGIVAGKYMAENYKDGKVAILHDKTPYGQGLADETKKSLNESGMKETLYEGVNQGDKDFSALISKMKAAGITAVYWGGMHPEAGLLIRQMADQGLKAQFISGDGIVSNELASIAGDAVAGVMNTFGPDPRDDKSNADLIKSFRDKGFEPEAYTFYAYAGVQSLVNAANAAGSNDPQEVATAMKEKGPFKTVLGDITFDAKGDPSLSPYVMFEWRKGEDGKYNYFQK